MLDVYRKLTLRKRIWILIALLGALAAVLIVVGLSIPIRSETLKASVIALLTEELESEVTIETLEGRVFPRVAVSGGGVVIRQKGRTDVPPMITIDRFEIRGSLRDLMNSRGTSAEVRLQGLQVKIPPGDDVDSDGGENAERNAQSGARKLQHVVIDRFEAPDTVITLIPKRAGKQPKVFTVHHLVMDSLGINETIPYIATLTNPVPKGEIETSGTFGPWNVAYPAQHAHHRQIHVCQREPRHHRRTRGRVELDRRVQRPDQSDSRCRARPTHRSSRSMPADCRCRSKRASRRSSTARTAIRICSRSMRPFSTRALWHTARSLASKAVPGRQVEVDVEHAERTYRRPVETRGQLGEADSARSSTAAGQARHSARKEEGDRQAAASRAVRAVERRHSPIRQCRPSSSASAGAVRE